MAQSETELLRSSVEALTGEIQRLRGETKDLRDYARRSRTLIWRQWVIITAVVILGLALGFVAIKARSAAQGASRAVASTQRNSVNARDSCLQANRARQTTRDLWNFALSAQGPTLRPLTPQETAARDALLSGLRTRVATAYADQDCSKFVPPPTGSK